MLSSDERGHACVFLRDGADAMALTPELIAKANMLRSVP